MPISQTGARMDTEAYEYLNEWREVSLTSVADIRFSSVNKVSQPGEEPVRLCNYTDVYNNDYVTADMDFMRATATKSEIERFGLQVGDVIITKDSETPDDIGIPTVVDTTAPDLVCGYHLALLRPNQDEVDPTFLAKQLAHHRIARYFGQQANGTTRYGLSTAAIANAPLHLPRPENQRSASALMRMVDAQIAQTKAVIAKLTQVRAGMLHDLLSYGLDEHGQLRDPIAHPEQFQGSPLGLIPVEWDVFRIDDVSEKVQDGTHFSPKSTSGPRRYLTSKNIRFGYLDLAECGWISENEHREIFRRCDVRKGDVLLTKDGANTGNAAINTLDDDFSLLSSVAFVRGKDGRLVSEYLLNYLLSPVAQKRIKDLMSGNAITRLTLQKIKDFTIPVPGYEEQRVIAAHLEKCTAKISAYAAELEGHKNIKSGIQEDLLTGQVRVPETIIMEGAENA